MPDWAQVRRDTPAAEHRLHFNNAGSALPTRQVLQAQHDFLDLEGAIGGYEALAEQAEAAARPYTALAELINCSPDEIAIVTSSTTAWFQVFGGLDLKAGDRILTSISEYGSNFLAFLQATKRHQVEVEIVKEDGDGNVDLEHLKQLIAKPTRKPALIAITYIPTSSGRVYSNAADIGAIAQEHDVPYLLDGTQAVGQIPVDVKALGCDYLTSTGRKFLRGPRGTGFLYASRKVLERGGEPALVDVHGGMWTGERSYKLDTTAKRYEVYEMAYAAKVGLGVAVDYVLELGIEPIWERIQHLSRSLRKKLQALPGAHVHDLGRVLCGIVSFSLDNKQPDDVKAKLNAMGINISVAPAEWTLLDYTKRGLDKKTLRASVHYYNTEEEIDRFIAALQKL